MSTLIYPATHNDRSVIAGAAAISCLFYLMPVTSPICSAVLQAPVRTPHCLTPFVRPTECENGNCCAPVQPMWCAKDVLLTKKHVQSMCSCSLLDLAPTKLQEDQHGNTCLRAMMLCCALKPQDYLTAKVAAACCQRPRKQTQHAPQQPRARNRLPCWSGNPRKCRRKPL